MVDNEAAADAGAVTAALDAGGRRSDSGLPALTFEVSGMNGTGATVSGSCDDEQESWPLRGNGPLDAGTIAPGTTCQLQFALLPSGPRGECTFSSETFVMPDDDLTIAVVCQDRFPSAPSYAPTSSITVSSTGEPTNLMTYDSHFVFAANATATTAASLIAFDASSTVLDVASLDAPATSIFSEGGSRVFLLNESIRARDGLHGLDAEVWEDPSDEAGLSDPGNSCDSYAAAWTGSAVRIAEHCVENSFVESWDGVLFQDLSPDLSKLEQSTPTDEQMAAVDSGLAAGPGLTLTTGTFDARGLELVIYQSGKPVSLAYLAGVGSATRPRSLSYANGKVWIASVEGITTTWSAYDVTF